MKKDHHIQNAIDESLSCVRFNAQDVRTVLRTVRSQETPRQARVRRSSGNPLRFALTAAAMVMVIAPLSLFVLRAQNAKTTSIDTILAASQPTHAPQEILPGEDPILSPFPAATVIPSPDPAGDGVFDERDAVSIARKCFEAQCDTSVFSFDEYTVSVTESENSTAGKENSTYTIQMDCIYDNGCSFRVTVCAPDGKILSHSTPKLATVPMYVNSESSEVRAWYDQYGPYLFTWPMDVQAEFSRRYEGATLRMPRENEVDAQTIARRFGPHIHISDLTDDPNAHSIAYYIMLYSERASSDGVARYQVYCFPGSEITDTLPSTYALLTFRASDGEFESRQILSTSGL